MPQSYNDWDKTSHLQPFCRSQRCYYCRNAATSVNVDDDETMSKTIPISDDSECGSEEINSAVINSKNVKSPLLKEKMIQTVEGVNYFTYGNTDLEQHYRRVKELPLRDDDVIITGFPRSGHHWTFEVVHMVLRQNTKFADAQFYSRLMDFQDANNEHLESLASPRILASHYWMPKLPRQVAEKPVKIIYIMRNPKDVMVSLYNFTKNFAWPSCSFTGSWDEFFDLHTTGEFPWGPWFSHVKAAETFMKQAQLKCSFHVLVYERLKRDPVPEIKKLCRFLNCPEHLAGDIAAKTSFDHMKFELKDSKLKIQGRLFTNGTDGNLRKGAVQDWKEWFSPEQNMRYNELFEENMSCTQLGKMVKSHIGLCDPQRE